MDRILGFAIVLVLLIVAVVLVVPSFVDWNDYRDQIERYAEQATGRNVSIDGPIGLVLLPQPSLSIEDLTIAGPLPGAGDGAGPGDSDAEPLMQLERLEVHAALAPVLMGEIEVQDLTLVNPRIVLELAQGERLTWSRPGTVDDGSGPAPAVSRILQGLVRAIRLDEVRIRNAELIYRNRKRDFVGVATNINGTFSAHSLQGPMKFDARTDYRGVPLKVSGSVGDLSTVRSVPFSASIVAEQSETGVAWTGFLHEARFDGPFSGTLRIEGNQGARSLQDLLTLVSGSALLPENLDQAGQQKISMTTKLSGADGRFATEDLTLNIGGSRFTGIVESDENDPGLYRASLTSASLDLDRLMGQASLWQKWQTAQTARPVGPDTPARQDPSAATLIPRALRGTFDIDIATLTQNGAVLRAVAATGMTQGGQIIFDRISAQLPGSAELEMQARSSSDSRGTTLEGSLRFNTPNPFRTFDWLGLSTRGLYSRTSPASLRAAFTATPRRQALQEFAASVNGQDVSGSLAIENGDTRLLSIDLFAQELDAHRWAQLFHLDDPRPGNLLDPDSDLMVNLAFGTLRTSGLDIRNVRLSTRVEDGTFTIDELHFEDATGAQTDLSGTFKGPLSAPAADLSGSIRTKNFEAFLDLFGASNEIVRFPGPADFTLGVATSDAGKLSAKADGIVTTSAGDPMTVAARLSGSSGTYMLDLGANNASSKLNLSGEIVTGGDRLVYDLLATADAANWTEMMAVLGHSFETEQASTAPFSVSAKLKGSTDRLDIQALSARAAGSEIRGDISVSRRSRRAEASGTTAEKAPLEIDGDLELINVNIEEFWPQSKGPTTEAESLPREIEQLAQAVSQPEAVGVLSWVARQKGKMRLRGRSATIAGVPIEQFECTAELREGTIRIGDLTGQIFAGKLSGDLAFDFDELVPELTTGFTIAGADLGKLSAFVSGAGQDQPPLTGKGALKAQLSLLGETQISQRATMSGTASLEAEDGVINGFDLAAFETGLDTVSSLSAFAAHANESLPGGATRFASLSGKFLVEEGILRTGKDTGATPDGGAVTGQLTAQADGKSRDLGRIQVAGELDLNARLVSGAAKLYLASRPQARPVTLRLFGPADAVTLQVDSSAMGADLVEEFADRAPATEFLEEDQKIEMFRKGIESLEDRP